MLSKEEYIDIIENLDFFYGDNLITTAELRKKKSKEIQEKDLENFKQKINCLKQLINEHFDNLLLELEKQSKRIQELELKEKQWIETERDYRDELKELKRNPPLKFEELKEGIWVWDNKFKIKLLIAYCYSKDDMAYYNFSNPEDYKYIHIDFEENRFYRREVKKL